jgi:hypothetical protein
MTVWVEMKEKYHSSPITVFWKPFKNAIAAKHEENMWNQFNNPQEHLTVLRISKFKPENLKRTRYGTYLKQVI